MQHIVQGSIRLTHVASEDCLKTKPYLHFAVGTLGVLAIVQAGFLWQRSKPEIPEGPVLGEQWPALELFSLESGARTTIGNQPGATDSCTIVVAIATSCGACALMRDRWNVDYAMWLDSVKAPIRVAWIAAADSDVLEEFYNGYQLAEVRKVRMPLGDPSFRNRLGIYATPTIYLLDRNDKLRTGSLGFNLPPADSAAQACRVPV